MSVSAIGLDYPHIEEHFDDTGLCQCPCSECTTRTSRQCVCEQCRCETDADHGPPLMVQGGILSEPFHFVEPDLVEGYFPAGAPVDLRVVFEARWMQLVGQLNERFPLADGQQWVFDAAPIPGLATATFTTSGWYHHFVADLLVDTQARWAEIRRALLSRMRSMYRARHR